MVAQFTKKAIIESFVKLLNKVPLDKITVKAIVEECGINRNTFYYHFQDIYALIDEVFKAETQKVIGENVCYKSWQEGFLQSTKFALENKKMIYHAYNSLSREQLETYLYHITDNLMMGFVKEQAEGLHASEEDIRFIADLYKYALVGLTLEWIRNGMKEDPEKFIYKMGRLLEGNIKTALSKSNMRSTAKCK